MRFSNTIYSAAKYYNLDARQMVAIIHQESRWDESVAVVVHNNGSIDLGLAQINQQTAIDYDLDIAQLIADPHYSIWAHAKILEQKIKVCQLKRVPASETWSCYHSYTKKHRKKYEKLVRRWL